MTNKVSETGKATDWTYFALHNLISVVIFIGFSLLLDLYSLQTEVISEIVSRDHITFIGNIFFISIMSSITGRVFAYLILRYIFNRSEKKTLSKFSNLNSGYNKIDLKFFIVAIINSLLFSIGATVILQNWLFGSDALIFLVLSYIILKLTIIAIVYWKIG